jgi:aspartyl protease family protein
MADPNGPWARKQPTPPRSPFRLYIWLGLMVAIIGSVWLLARAFPEQRLGGLAEGRLYYLVTLLALVASGIVFGRQFKWRESLRNIAIWGGIAALLVVGYLYQDVIADIGNRLRAEFMPGEPQTEGAGTVVLTQDDNGQFVTVGEVNGTRVKFLIDTGASDIVLAPEDARRAGIDPATLTYNRMSETANGVGNGASATVDSLAVGPIRFSHVNVTVNQAAMGASLLGMPFLHRLKSFEFSGRKLTLRY